MTEFTITVHDSNEDNARQLAQWVEWLQPLDYTTVTMAENNYAMLPNERAAALKP